MEAESQKPLSRGKERRGEWLPFPLVWMFYKLSRGKGNRYSSPLLGCCRGRRG